MPMDISVKRSIFPIMDYPLVITKNVIGAVWFIWDGFHGVI